MIDNQVVHQVAFKKEKTEYKMSWRAIQRIDAEMMGSMPCQ